MARARRGTQSTSGRATRSTTARKQSSASATAKTASTTGAYKCPECGRTFSRPAALGAHRRRAHGVPGASASAAGSRATRARGRTTARRSAQRPARASATRDGIDRDTLLAALFPQGIPPRENVIREVNRWLDEADRLVRLR